jgi:hypothetical protein
MMDSTEWKGNKHEASCIRNATRKIRKERCRNEILISKVTHVFKAEGTKEITRR